MRVALPGHEPEHEARLVASAREAGHEVVPVEQAEIVIAGSGTDRSGVRLVCAEPLGDREAALLFYLLANPSRTVTRDELLERVWGWSSSTLTRTLDQAVRRLRSKVEPDPSHPVRVLTVHGSGYRFEPPTPARVATREAAPELSRRAGAPPPETDRFFGRERELAEIQQRLAAGERVLTLLGPAGAGKTRLLGRAARNAGELAFFAAIADARSRDEVVAAVARGLGIPLSSSRDGAMDLGHALAGRGRLVLFLDNAEQAIAPVGELVGQWLTAAPEASFVVTSRERLRVAGERVLDVEPLPAPDARALFLDRAKSAGGIVAEEDAGTVDRIVGVLDGLPLAIELAASRARTFAPEELLERLSDRLGVGRPRRDVSARQATLRGALDWQWGLLEPEEQEAVADASVFRGGFTREAFDAVSRADFELLDDLVDQCLVRAGRASDDPSRARFSMYGFIQAYAGEKARELGRLEAAERRHADVILRLAEAHAARVWGRGGAGAIAAITMEQENLIAIVERFAASSPATARRAALVLDPLLYLRGPASLHRHVLDAALAAPAEDAADVARRARLLRGRADLDRREVRYAAAEAQLDEARRLAASVDDADNVDEIDITWGLGRLEQGRWDDAIQAFERAFDRAVHRPHSESVQALATFYRGVVDEWRGRFPEALARLRDARARFAELGDRNREGVAASDLGAALLAAGHEEEARAVFDDAIAICRELGAPRREAMVLVKIATAAFGAGRLDEAEAAWTRAQRLHAEVGNRRELAIAIGNLGWLAEEQGRIAESHQRLAEALRLHRAMGNRRSEGVAVGNLALWTLTWGPAGEGPGDPGAAITGLETALRALDEVGDPRGAGYFRSWLGAARAAAGDFVGAEREFTAAEVKLGAVPHPGMLAVLAVHRAWARALRGDPDAAARVVTETAATAARSAEVRHAIRGMERDLRRRAGHGHPSSHL